MNLPEEDLLGIQPWIQDDEEDDCNSLIDTLYKWAAIMAIPIIIIIGVMIIMGLLKLCDMLFQ